ncbi:MAG TPA: hypothetical protein VHZ55_33750 [Bryobacteraceae bacterium]|jgi:hypothetical protein|nr:hypothetical protein [Bryobacteraceae bacterium]
MPLEPVPAICTAIEQTRLIQLIYHGKIRILEPHDHGIRNGSVQLLGYQVAGASRRRLPNWLLMKTDEITGLNVLDQTFPGGRPTSSGNHIKWDKLFIRVKPAPVHSAVASS